LTRLAAKNVPVEVQLSGNLPAGYRLTGKSVFPETLSIAGSENRVAAVTQVQTDPIDLRSLTQSGEHRVNAFVDDPQVRFESQPVVRVTLTIERRGR